MRGAERSRGPSPYSARISTPGGTLVLPAASPYEWQLLCEHVAVAASHRGAVRLRVGGVDCLVRTATVGAAPRYCSGCARALPRVAFRMGWRDLCADCARSWVAREPADISALASAGPTLSG